MEHTACTIKHIVLTTISNGTKYYGGIDMYGYELTDAQLTLSGEADVRMYYCKNCKEHFDGTVGFEEVKQHFGTFPVDEPRHPF
jgi:hypothetical protein